MEKERARTDRFPASTKVSGERQRRRFKQVVEISGLDISALPCEMMNSKGHGCQNHLLVNGLPSSPDRIRLSVTVFRIFDSLTLNKF